MAESTKDNGQRRWQVRPKERVVVTLPVIQDPASDRWDIRYDAERAAKYEHKEVGRETIAGRVAIHLQITPPGGLPY